MWLGGNLCARPESPPNFFQAAQHFASFLRRPLATKSVVSMGLHTWESLWQTFIIHFRSAGWLVAGDVREMAFSPSKDDFDYAKFITFLCVRFHFIGALPWVISGQWAAQMSHQLFWCSFRLRCWVWVIFIFNDLSSKTFATFSTLAALFRQGMLHNMEALAFIFCYLKHAIFFISLLPRNSRRKLAQFCVTMRLGSAVDEIWSINCEGRALEKFSIKFDFIKRNCSMSLRN